MSDVSVEDGSTTSDVPSLPRSGLNVTQTVNQAQAQSNTQQQQQQQQEQPVLTPVVTPQSGQLQFQSMPTVIMPATTHAQAQGLLAQLQALLSF
jgi:hypothetical protein